MGKVLHVEPEEQVLEIGEEMSDIEYSKISQIRYLINLILSNKTISLVVVTN